MAKDVYLSKVTTKAIKQQLEHVQLAAFLVLLLKIVQVAFQTLSSSITSVKLTVQLTMFLHGIVQLVKTLCPICI